MSKIFGGSKSKSTQQSQAKSYNRSFDIMNDNIGSAAYSGYNSGMSALQNELGGGFEAYKDNRSFDFMNKLGLDRIGGNMAGRGVFNSGATLKALSEYDNQMHNQYYQDYLNNLFNQANLGQGGAALIGQTGQVSESSSSGSSSGSSNSGGLGGFIGTLGAGIAMSDRRAKKDIVKIGKLPSGLNVYSFKYVWSDETFEGVMADEVAELLPEALGPVIAGYQTVNYDKVA